MMRLPQGLQVIAALAVLGHVCATGVDNGFVSFSQQQVVDVEPDMGSKAVVLPMQRTGGTTGTITVFVSIVNETNDFLAREESVSFGDGVTMASVQFYVVADSFAEGNETYIVRITDILGGGEISQPSSMLLVIMANDEPFGVVTFQESSQNIQVTEPIGGTPLNVELLLQRQPGIFGTVSVDWQMVDGPGLGVDDFAVTSGQVTFVNEQGQASLLLEVQPDSLPEDAESFTVRLVSSRGGAALGSMNEVTAMVTISGNDVPLRFTQSTVRVDEGVGSLDITIVRGSLDDGTVVGPLDVNTTVDYVISAGTATAGVDYSGSSGRLTFPVGSASQTISLDITDDSEPEGDETFSITLSMPSSDAVLVASSSVTVIISVNDDAGGVASFVSEDIPLVQEDVPNPAIVLMLQRMVGTSGDLVLAWSVVESSRNQLATEDFRPPNGTVVIFDGQDQAVLRVPLLNDTMPETPELFTVRLDGVVRGGGRIDTDGVRVVMITVADSDDAYGRVEWGGDNTLQVTADPRQLTATIVRFGGVIGTISVGYHVLYLPPGVTDASQGLSDMLMGATGSVRLGAGEGSASITVNISSEALLEPESNFYINITDVVLTEANPILSASQLSSPRIGIRSSVLVPVPLAVSNGLIGFEINDMTVEEPADGSTTAVELVIFRSGTFGQASVLFRISSMSDSFNRTAEVSQTTGIAVIEDGSNTATITFSVLPDVEPELDEVFQVTLTEVTEANQAIDPTSSVVNVTILSNDNPEGMFSFTSTSTGPHVIDEAIDANNTVTLTVYRSGGTLTQERIIFRTIPSARSDLLGSEGVVEFTPGTRLMNIILAPRDDVIPELNETFLVELFNQDGSKHLIEEPSSVNLTITENDDPHGVFSFAAESLNVAIDEVPNNGITADTHTARLTVQREAGVFGPVTVTWSANGTMAADLDLTPTSGTVDFAEGQTTAVIDITTVDDQVPETEERFSIGLTSASNGGRLAVENTIATLTVDQNDDAIVVNNAAVEGTEGSTLSLRISRGGRANGVAAVEFTVTSISAGIADYTVLTPSPVTFADGQTSAEVVVSITDDNIPEIDEEFQMMLVSTTGDSVIRQPDTTTVIIAANDDPMGIFSIAETSRVVSFEEGSQYQLTVVRGGGTFGNVTVQWQITAQFLTDEATGTSLDFTAASGQISFVERSTEENLTLDVLVDGIPELDELFTVQLLGTLGGGRLSEDNSTTLAQVTVLANESPHGLLQFSADTLELDTAEDVPVSNQTADEATLTIERMQGRFGNITVLWEAFPSDSVPNASFVDLLLRGMQTEGITSASPRPDTDTWALQFTGDAVVTVVTQEQPTAADINDGFTISLWLTPTLASDGGFLLAKAKDGQLLYGLELRTLFAVVFSFRPPPPATGLVEVSAAVSSFTLLNGQSHHLCAVVNSTHVTFYLDGTHLMTNTLPEGSSLNDQDEGSLIVGGWQASRYEGVLQDVRVYSQPLSASDVTILASDVAALDVTPISGYITLAEGEDSVPIIITAKMDSVPEPPEVFSVTIADSSGGGEITGGDASVATLTVLKSDFSNGVFSFRGPEFSLSVVEQSPPELVIVRREGLYGYVTVTWQVVNNDTNTLATPDFNQATGSVVFAPTEYEKVLVLNITDDTEPELAETFVVSLVDVTVAGSDKLTTPTSGAVINTNASQLVISVEENDDPYGLIQFWTEATLPSTTIPPLIKQPEVSVLEEDIVVELTVVRAQGLLGTVSVEYQTMNGNATDSVDYISAGGTVTFAEGERVKTIEVVIIDDTTPELGRQFFAELVNPTGVPKAPSLGPGSRVAVNILPSDDAFGVFAFSAESRSTVVQESAGSVTLTVERMGGALGVVSVYWEVQGAAAEDISPTSGVVGFAEGQTTAALVLTILNDTVPEFAEAFIVILTNLSNGELDSAAAIATVTLEASDDPYGSFAFAPTSQPLRVGEGIAVAMVTIIREFGTAASVEVSFRTLASSTLPGELQSRAGSIADDIDDFQPISSGSVVFQDGETQKAVNLTIIDDIDPEVDESIFLMLTNAVLLSEPRPGDNGLRPRIVNDGGQIGEVIIEENDNARGVIDLASEAVNTTEPSTSLFLSIQRSAGLFGEVEVEFRVTSGTATISDYAPTLGSVTLITDQSSASIPITIIDDTDPEFDETFTVELIRVTGGATFGQRTQAVVTILANDDPNGRFEFAPDSLSQSVSEPSAGSSPVSLSIERQGGLSGVVQVQWTASITDGGDVSGDLLSTSGTLQFLTGVSQQTLTLSILADDIPEETEVVRIQLTDPSNGANIGVSSVAEISIPANDDPYGVVEFSADRITISEIDTNVSVFRRQGTFGELQVFYTVEELSVTVLATNDGTPAINYFSTVPSTTLPSNFISSSTATSTLSPSTECAERCLSELDCRSFFVDRSIPPVCHLSRSTSDIGILQEGSTVYDKLVNRVRPFQDAQALQSQDFQPVVNGFITISAGASVGSILLSVVDDTTPELAESFSLHLESVERVGASEEDPPPTIGSIRSAWVTIEPNDDPYGRFSIATTNGRLNRVVVPESENFAVSLTVERMGGALGRVQVSWTAVGSTATLGEDYLAPDFTLTFSENEVTKSIILGILPDSIPERDETIILSLVNATNGAVVATGEGGSVTVVIESNDNAAGIVGVAPQSRSAVVEEGRVAVLQAERLIGSEGEVEVDWVISGGGNVSAEFMPSRGTAVFQDGSSEANILFVVVEDLMPELSERYTLTLTGVRTVSADVSPTGYALLSNTNTMATITIAASNSPHGVIEFLQSATVLNISETTATQLTIIREFGTIGAVVVTYRATVAEGSSAIAEEDFFSQERTVTFANGEESKTVDIPVIDDTTPELAESFIVQLISVQLLDLFNNTSPPFIGPVSTVTINILPNDSPQGEFVLEQSTLSLPEGSTNHTLRVLREAGAFGEVSVSVFALLTSATIDLDFSFQTIELFFADGEVEKTISFSIFDDGLPEDDEEFTILLNGPEGGAILGEINRTIVTIEANDEAYGVFSLAAGPLNATLEEAGTTTSEANIARFQVQRIGGLFREVSVPYEVELGGRSDLAPPTGSVVFLPNQNEATLELTAVMDEFPELTESYSVQLMDPTLGRLAADRTTAEITILPNQDPYGLFEVIALVDSSSTSISVEEGSGALGFEVRRAFGTFGSTSVQWRTSAETATDNTGGTSDFLAVAQKFPLLQSADNWLPFTHEGTQYLLQLSDAAMDNSFESSRLYQWKGSFVLVQNLSTSGASAADAFTATSGQTYVAVANAGSSSNKSVDSVIYEVVDGQLIQVQLVPTSGASDVIFFTAADDQGQPTTHLLFVNQEDDMGSLQLESTILRWNGTHFISSQSLLLQNPVAAVTFSVSTEFYLAVASGTDVRSSLYVWRQGLFTLLGSFATTSASDIAYFQRDGLMHYVAVSSSVGGVTVFSFSETTETLNQVSVLVGNGTTGLEAFTWDGQVNLIVLHQFEATEWLQLQTNSTFTMHASFYLPVAAGASAFTSPNGTRHLALSTVTEQVLYRQTVFTPEVTDYISAGGTLWFDPGESSHMVYVHVVEDGEPELDELFQVELSNPTGGARIGSRGAIDVVIATNDNAHGIIGFAERSRSVMVQESSTDVTISLVLERLEGSVGVVEVEWRLEGDHTSNEVRPNMGRVVFLDNVTEGNFDLFVTADGVPELNEVTRVTLRIIQSGVEPGVDPARGAMISSSNGVAVITVLANDEPHGVFTWASSTTTATEVESGSNDVRVTIVREFGAVGVVEVSFTTVMATEGTAQYLAAAGKDYVPTTATALMENGVTSVTVVASRILPDTIPETDEIFWVNITGVRLVNESARQGSITQSPRVGQPVISVSIATNDDANGIVEFAVNRENDSTVHVEEIAGAVQLLLRRAPGQFGQVSVTWQAVGMTALGEGVDFEPGSGIVTFQDLQETVPISISIVNDLDPELEETFRVELVSVDGGARLGNDAVVVVTILRSDDINGVFQFTGLTVFILPESVTPDDPNSVATFTVSRTRGSVGRVEVYWEVSEANAESDLAPASGTLVFPEGGTVQNFSIRALGDNVAEGFETFTITLVSASNGGRVFGTTQANIGIPTSDDPSGVVQFRSYPEGIVVMEGDLLTARLLRLSGTIGIAVVTWEVTPADSNTFVVNSGQAVFENGQETADIEIETRSDSSPEVATRYQLVLVTAEQARIDFDNSVVEVFVVASDNPHGVVEFGQPFQILADEGVGVTNVPVLRNFGSVGTVMVNFTVITDTATAGVDYVIQEYSIIFAPSAISAVIPITVIDDAIPELAEAFQLRLESIELINTPNFGRDFTYNGSANLDIPPALGGNRLIEFIINENDDARGVITFNMAVYRVVEGTVAIIGITRSGGSFGAISVDYRVIGGSAVGGGVDFEAAEGVSTLLLQSGQTAGSVDITIVDDLVPELQEQFSIELLDVDNGATLGEITTATVIISSSDAPSGVISFGEAEVAGIVVTNPSTLDGAQLLGIQVLRTGSLEGTVQVQWEVTGPEPGREALDIDQATLQGILTFTSGQSSGLIRIWILPGEDPEAEEVFIVSFVTASGGAVFDPNAPARVIITQRGMPFGVVGFAGEALDPRVFVERNTTTLVHFPVSRTEGALGTVEVFFSLVGVGDTLADISPLEGSVVLSIGVSRVNITLTILADRVPEVEEAFSLRLTEAQGGATIDAARNVSTFSIRANNVPYGEFALGQASLVVEMTPVVTRSIVVNVLRELGTFGTVRCTVTVTYNENPSASFVTSPTEVDFDPGETSRQLTLSIIPSAFLSQGASFTITITSVQLLSSGDSSVPPVLSPVGASTMVVVTSASANPLLSFSPESLEPSVDLSASARNVEFVVAKIGTLGDVVVTWVTGLPPADTQPGLVNGSLTPVTGSFLMASNQTRATFSLTATPAFPHGVREIFVVNLQVESAVGVAAGVDPSFSQAVVEPFGVIQLGGSRFIVLEGQQVDMVVWRRFGSQGNIRVTGMATVVSEASVPPEAVAAVPNTDFPPQPVSLLISDGAASGVISVPIPDNSIQERVRVFQFALTAVERDPPTAGLFTSPRLSTQSLSALVSITDDEGGSGIFQFSSTTSIQVAESGNVTVVVGVVRARSTIGRVQLQLTSFDGSISNTALPAATGGLDYKAINETLVFENGEILKEDIVLSIFDDNEPELAEYLTLRLVNAYGEAVLSGTASTLEVIISQNDNALGVFSLTETAIALNDDDRSSVMVSISRTGGQLEGVSLEWSVDYTTLQQQQVLLSSLFVETRGRVIFSAGQTTASFSLALQPTNVPQDGIEVTLTLISLTPGVVFAPGGDTAAIVVAPCSQTVYSFAQQSRFLVTEGRKEVSLTIERPRCIFVRGNVLVSSSTPTQSVQLGALTLQPAMKGVDFTSVSRVVQFDDGEFNETITVTILNEQLTEERVFYASLSPTLLGGQVEGGDATVIITPQGQRSQLLPLYIQTLEPFTSIEQLERVAAGLLSALRPPNTITATPETVEVVKLILSYITNTVVAQRLLYSSLLGNTVLDIYGAIFESSPFSSSLREFTPLLQDFAYSHLITSPCPANDGLRLCVPSSTSQSCIVNILVNRSLTVDLVSKTYSFDDSRNFVQLPDTQFSNSATCSNVLYMEYNTDEAFAGGTLSNKVLTIGVQGSPVISESQFVTYRIYAPSNNRILPQGEECLYWFGDRWLSDRENQRCESPRSELLSQNYIECRCSLLGNFSARAELSTSYGWFWPAPASCGLVILVLVAAFVLHVFFYDRLTSAAILIVNLLVAIFLLQLFAMVTMVVSEITPLAGCTVMGIALHLTILAQFSIMAVISAYLWITFFTRFKKPRPIILFIAAAWALPVICVLISILVLVPGFGFSIDSAYGLALPTATTCYIPQWYIALGATIIPVALFLVVILLTFLHAAVFHSKWAEREGVYNYSFNRQDVIYLLIWFAVITVTWLFAALHAYIGNVIIFGFFVACNIILAIYTLVIYVFFGWERLSRRYKKRNIPQQNSIALTPLRASYKVGSRSPNMAGSKQHLVEEEGEAWQDTVSPYDRGTPEKVVPIAINPTRSSHEGSSSRDSFDSSCAPSETEEDSHFNNLMFMLRTGGNIEAESSRNSQPSASERYELRRISIADTHL